MQACECLVMACALELRLYLERGALMASQQAARSLVAQVRPPWPCPLSPCMP